jgi:ABC-type multidrug transport system ATPase subunit
MLTVKNLYYRYNNRADYALQNINFTLSKNSITGIAGQTGSGKSTLLHCIYGKYDLLSGEIIFDGKPVLGPSNKLIPGHENMQLVNQQFKTENEISVEENLLRSMLGYDDAYKKKRTKELLKLCGLSKYKHYKPFQLSGGQQQLLCICMALAVNPKLLLLDEPFGHLDYITKKLFIDALLLIKIKLNINILIVSHDAQDLLSLCDTIIVLKNGKLIEIGTPVELYNHAKNLYTHQLFGPVNYFSKKHILSKKYESCFIRPEVLKISKKGHQVKIKKCLFAGQNYLLECSDKFNETIYLYSKKYMKNGKQINII